MTMVKICSDSDSLKRTSR